MSNQSIVSQYLSQAVFGQGNRSWIEHPELDPMFGDVQKNGLKWAGAPSSEGWHRIHYMHCSGVWVDRVCLIKDGDRFKIPGVEGWADHLLAEWMPIPADFAMPSKTDSTGNAATEAKP